MKHLQETIQRNLVLASVIFGFVGSLYGGYQLIYSKGADAAVEKINPRLVAIETNVIWLIKQSDENKRHSEYTGSMVADQRGKP